MKKYSIYFKKFFLTSRYDKPHGILFLFYPCLWGITISNVNILEVYQLCIIFFFGACGMRAVGCIWNDLNDKKFDINVKRTDSRLIATGQVSKKESAIYIFLNFIIGSLPLLFISKFAILLCIFVLPLIMSYPFMKRITWWPQAWLGINFNWGILVGYYALKEPHLNLDLMLFYLGAIFWTIAYDTIYGFQDINDDLRIGVKSTSIKFKGIPRLFLLTNYLLCYLCWSISLFSVMYDDKGIILLTILFILILISALYTNFKDPISCAKSFKRNSYFGFGISIFLIYFNISI